MNKIDIAISGNPKGHQQYGDATAKKYAENLYGSAYTDAEYPFMSIEIKQENSAWCFYYTYVVSKTKEVDARPGGHCAIIIRVENEYCEDLSRLYQLLKQLFDAKIRNVFIDRNNKFLVSNFEDKKTNADDLISTLRTILSQKFKSSFSELKQRIAPADSRIERHISEFGCDLYLDTLFKHKSVFLSPEIHQMAKEIQPLKERNEKLQIGYNQLKEALDNEKTELRRKNAEIEKLRAELNRLKFQNNNWNDILEDLKSFEKDLKSQRNTINKLKTDIKTSLPKPEGNPVDVGWAKNKNKILITLLAILVLVGGFFSIKSCFNGGDTESSTSTATENTTKEEITWKSEKDFILNDTLEISEESVKIGEIITFKLKDSRGEIRKDTAKWGLDGFDKQKVTPGCITVTVTKNENDTATISFTAENDTLKYRKRFLIVK